MTNTLGRPAWFGLAIALQLVALLWCSTAHASPIDIPRPDQRAFVLDRAELLDDATEAEIRACAEALLSEHATPIVVVTITSMADHGGAGMRIETFAQVLFDEWGIGHPTLSGQAWNTGILVLVSPGDHAARIELGGGWGRDHEAQVQRIMSERMVPRFAAGDWNAGTLAGVLALSEMARGEPLPRRSDSRLLWWSIAVVGVAALAVFTAVSLIRSGSSGWAWAAWGLVFTIVFWWLLRRRPRPRPCAGRFRGGSFGGGTSDGGGATGKW